MITIELHDTVMLEIYPGTYKKTTGWELANDTPGGGRIKRPSTRKSTNNGILFSRRMALITSAIEKGTWSTGVQVDRDEMIGKLPVIFSSLAPEDYPDVTVNALKRLKRLAVFHPLPQSTRTSCLNMIELIETRSSNVG